VARLPDHGHAVRLQDCKISTFGRALHRLDQVQAAWRAAARHWWQFAKVAKSRGFTSLHGGTSYGQIVILAVLSGPGVFYHVPTHVRTRLDRQRNYFRIYMISHALISDSVVATRHGCQCNFGSTLLTERTLGAFDTDVYPRENCIAPGYASTSRSYGSLTIPT